MITAEAAARLAAADPYEVEELMCKASLGFWTERRMNLPMSPLHWEWCGLRQSAKRLAVVAPREHAKSETFTVNGTAWESVYTPGLQTAIFCETKEQAQIMLAKIRKSIEIVDPELVRRARVNTKQSLVLSNYASIEARGAGSAVRGMHPDVIIGDDVLSEAAATSKKARDQTMKWWFGAIGGMAHPGTNRTIGVGRNSIDLWFPASRIYLVGTPFHKQDLLMGMAKNPVWSFRRYAAEFHESELVDGTMAIEVF